MHVAVGLVSYAHFTESGSTPFAIAASMFLAMLFLSLMWFSETEIIPANARIMIQTIEVVSIVVLEELFVSVNFITFVFVKNVATDLVNFFQLPSWVNVVCVVVGCSIGYIL